MINLPDALAFMARDYYPNVVISLGAKNALLISSMTTTLIFGIDGSTITISKSSDKLDVLRNEYDLADQEDYTVFINHLTVALS